MAQVSWNSLNLLSFIGLETSLRQGREKRSAKDLIKNIIGGVSKGGSFLQLWEEGRALR